MFLCILLFVCALLRNFAGDLREGSLLGLVLALQVSLERTKSAVVGLNLLCFSSFSVSRDFEDCSFLFLERSDFWCWSGGTEALHWKLSAFMVSPLLLCFCKLFGSYGAGGRNLEI